MGTNDIVTKEDLNLAVSQLMVFIMQSLKEANLVNSKEYDKKRYFRTKDVLDILSVSRNKLKQMRLSGEIPFVKKGTTFFYPEKEFYEALATLK